MIDALVIDDDYRVAQLHVEFVNRVPGFRVAGVAHSGLDAIAAVDRLRPDLLLLDIYLPDLSGIEVLHRLRQGDHPDVDVIAVTAARDVETLRSAIRGGVLHYLVKPFRFATFEEKLHSYAAARARLERLGEAEQPDIDRVFGALRSAASAPLPKGLSETTLELVLQALARARSGLPAAALADRVGVSRVTARRYLDHLCQAGRAEIALRYGAPGRPEHRYRLLRR